MGGGGKSTTTRAIGTSNLLDTNKNLFAQDLMRAVATTGSYNPLTLSKIMNHNLMSYDNVGMFSKFGVAPKIQMSREVVTNNAIISALSKQGITATTIDYATTENIYCMPLFVNEQLALLYTKNSTISYTAIQDYTYTYSGTTYTGSVSKSLYQYQVGTTTVTYYLDANNNQVFLQSDTTGFYIVDNNINYYLQNQPLYYNVSSVSGSRNYTIIFSVDADFKQSDGTVITKTIYNNISLPTDNKVYYLICYNNSSAYCLSRDQIIAETFVDSHALMYVIKHDGNIVSQNTNYKKVLYMKMGLMKSDFDSQFTSNSDVKDVVITYSANLNDPKYISVIEEIYGTPNNRNTVTINGEITLQYTPSDSTYNLNIDGNRLSIDTNSANDSTNEYMLMPIEMLHRVAMNKRYEYIKDLSNVFWYASHTTKKKWYQSGLFSLIVMAVAVTVFKISPAIILGSYTAVQIASQISPELGMAVSLFLAYEGFIKADSFFTKLPSLGSMLSTLSKEYFVIEGKKIQKQLQYINEEEKNAEKKIQDMKKKAIYMPLDYTNNYYDMIYSFQYNYDNMYNYDKIYQQNNIFA